MTFGAAMVCFLLGRIANIDGASRIIEEHFVFKSRRCFERRGLLRSSGFGRLDDNRLSLLVKHIHQRNTNRWSGHFGFDQ